MRIIKNKYVKASRRPIKAYHDKYIELANKMVYGSDGFTTDYTMYSTSDGDYYFCMFGDKDVYGPDPDYADFETWSEDEAWEWFNSYEGFNEDDDIFGVEEVVEDEANEDADMLQHTQEFSSKNTATNWKSGKLPHLHSHVSYNNGDVVLDYGGGTEESAAIAQDFFNREYPTVDYVWYDKYWQTTAQQNEALRHIKQVGGADVALLSNVLNVIKEPEVRNDILNHIKSLLKPGGKLYIYGYQGNKADQESGGRSTAKDQYQTFMKTKDYLSEIHAVFPTASIKNNIITAINDGAVPQVAASYNPNDLVVL